MALRQIRVAVKSFNGQCDTLCSECSDVRGIVDPLVTVDGVGILQGAIVPRISDNASIWTEGCQCYVNFEFDDVQLLPNTILRPCDICLVCGCIIAFVERQAGVSCPQIRACVDAGDTQTLNMSFNAGTGIFSGDVNVSANVDNDLSVLADGLFVPRPGVAAECPAGYFTGAPI